MINSYILLIASLLLYIIYMTYVTYLAKINIGKDSTDISLNGNSSKFKRRNLMVKKYLESLSRKKRENYKLITVFLLIGILITSGMSLQKYYTEESWEAYDLENILSDYYDGMYYEETETKLTVFGYSSITDDIQIGAYYINNLDQIVTYSFYFDVYDSSFKEVSDGVSYYSFNTQNILPNSKNACNVIVKVNKDQTVDVTSNFFEFTKVTSFSDYDYYIATYYGYAKSSEYTISIDDQLIMLKN
ncbi:MAG: hypothetical protein JEZ05_06325 [Tenericutes bacterium]|nr:hypothetical protein [Mycoplasmatota bacterium]